MCDESVEQLLISRSVEEKVAAMSNLLDDIQSEDSSGGPLYSVVDWHKAGFYTGLVRVMSNPRELVNQEFIEVAIDAIKALGQQEPLALEFLIQLIEGKLHSAGTNPPVPAACHPGLILLLAGVVEQAERHLVKEVLNFLLAYFSAALSVEQQVGLSLTNNNPAQTSSLATLSIINASAAARPRSNSTTSHRGSVDRLSSRTMQLVPKLELPLRGTDRGKRPSIDIIDPSTYFVGASDRNGTHDMQKATPRQGKQGTKSLPAVRALETCGHKIGQLYATLDAKTLLGMKKEHEALVSAEKAHKVPSILSAAASFTSGEAEPEIIITAPDKEGDQNPFAGFAANKNSVYQKVLDEYDIADDPLSVAARMVIQFLGFYSNDEVFEFPMRQHLHCVLSHEICAIIDRKDMDYLNLLVRSARKQSLILEEQLFRFFHQPVSLVGYPVESIGIKVPSDIFLQRWAGIVRYLVETVKPIPWETTIKWYMSVLAYYLEGIASSGRSLGIQAAAICLELLVSMLDTLRRNVSFTPGFATNLHYFLEVVDTLLQCYTIPSVLLQIFTTLLVETKGNPLTAFLREYTRRLLLEDPFTLFGLRRPQEASSVSRAESPTSTLFPPEKFDPILHLVRLIRHFRILGALSQPDSQHSHGPAARHFFVSMGDSINQLLDFLLNPFEGAALALLSTPPTNLTFPLYIEMLQLVQTVATGRHSGFLAKSKWVGTYTRFLYLSFLISYNSESFTQEDPVTVRLTELTLSALSTIVRYDQHARHKAQQLGIVNTLVHEVDLEHTVKDLREKHIRRSTVVSVQSGREEDPAAGATYSDSGMSPKSPKLGATTLMSSGEKFLTPNSPALGTKRHPSSLTLEAGETSPQHRGSPGQSPTSLKREPVTGSSEVNSNSGSFIQLSKGGTGSFASLSGLANSTSSVPPALAAAAAKLKMGVPKLSLGSVAPPMYYTSNGDTGMAAESIINPNSTALPPQQAVTTTTGALGLPPRSVTNSSSDMKRDRDHASVMTPIDSEDEFGEEEEEEEEDANVLSDDTEDALNETNPIEMVDSESGDELDSESPTQISIQNHRPPLTPRQRPAIPSINLTQQPPPSYYTSGPNEDNEEAQVVARASRKVGVGGTVSPPAQVSPKPQIMSRGSWMKDELMTLNGRQASLATTNSDDHGTASIGRHGSLSFKPGGSFMVDQITYPPSLLQNEGRFTAHQRSIRRIYVDLGVQVEILFLLMTLLVNPNGSLEADYLDSYTFLSRKINILFYIETHLNHSSNKKVAPKLAQKLMKSPNQGLRVLFQLLCANPKFQDTWTSGARIGNGAFGVVLSSGFAIGGNEAKATANLQGHAVKVIQVPKHIDDRAAIVPLHTEVLIMIQNRDLGGICELVDFGNDGAAYRLVMKKYSKSLSQWRSEVDHKYLALRKSTMTDSSTRSIVMEMLPVYLSIFLDVLTLVEKLHLRNVAHYDIKCDNIFLKSELTVSGECTGIYLGDFGESEIIQPEEAPFSSVRASQRSSRQKQGRGTEAIRAPECLVPHKFADRRRKFLGFHSDSWSLGCLLFELITGTHLFQEDIGKLIHRVTKDEGELLEEIHKQRLGNDPGLIQLFHFILTRDPSRRPLVSEVKRKVHDFLMARNLSLVKPVLHPNDVDDSGHMSPSSSSIASKPEPCSIVLTNTESAKLENFADFVDNTAVLHDRPSQFLSAGEVSYAMEAAENIPSDEDEGGEEGEDAFTGGGKKSEVFDAVLPHVIFMPHRPSVQELYEAGCTHCVTFGHMPDVTRHFHTLHLAQEIQDLIDAHEEEVVDSNGEEGEPSSSLEKEEDAEVALCRALVSKCVPFIQNTVVCNGQCVVPSLTSGEIDLGIVVILIYISVTYSVPLSTCMAHVRQVANHLEESVLLTSCVRLASCCLRIAKRTAYVSEETFTVHVKRPVVVTAQALQNDASHPLMRAMLKDLAAMTSCPQKPTQLFQCLCGDVCYELEPHEYPDAVSGPIREVLFDTGKGQVVPEDIMPHESISEYYIFLSEAYNTYVLESIFSESKVKVCNVKKLLAGNTSAGTRGSHREDDDFDLVPGLVAPPPQNSSAGGRGGGFKKWKPLNLLQLALERENQTKVLNKPTRPSHRTTNTTRSNPSTVPTTPIALAAYESARGQKGGWIKAGKEWRCRACRFPTHWESNEGCTVATHCAIPVRQSANAGETEEATKVLPSTLETPEDHSFSPGEEIPFSQSPSPQRRAGGAFNPNAKPQQSSTSASIYERKPFDPESFGSSLGSTAWYSKFHLCPIIPNAK